MNYLKNILLLYILLFTLNLFAIKDSLTYSRHFGAGQFGGQTIESFHYEYELISQKHFKLHTNLGLGLNQSGDDKINERAIYGIHSGLIGLAGIRPLFLELGINPTTYFYGKTTFVNLNSWFGLRLSGKKGYFIGLGYTPRLFTTFSDPTNYYVNVFFGLKFGINF